MTIDKISKIVFYALNTDLSYREYANLQAAVQANPYLIVQETSGTWFNYGYKNRVVELEIFNSLGKKISKVCESGWLLDSVDIKMDQSFQIESIYARITDPEGGQIPVKKYGVGFRGFLKSISILREMARFENMGNYLTHKENEKIKITIEKLSSEVKNLKSIVKTI